MMNDVKEKETCFKNLKQFLVNLIESIDDNDKEVNRKLNKEEILLLCEFYYKFNFLKKNHNTEKDLIKYLSLGYYIYSFMEKEDL